MTHAYNITGITCGNCVAKIRSELLKTPGITTAEVQQTAPQAALTTAQPISLDILQNILQKAGNYTITAAGEPVVEHNDNPSRLQTYKPVLLIFLYLLGITLIAATQDHVFHLMRAMNVFMAGFFLTFSFFKLIDLPGFATSYASYDIVSKTMFGWGYVYPFAELALGFAYATHFHPVVTNLFAFLLMSVSLAGVLQARLSKRAIECACPGAVFKLPMSTVTIVEDGLMILMSGAMLVRLLI